MLTTAEAQELIKVSKKVLVSEDILDVFSISIKEGKSERIYMTSFPDGEWNFFLEVIQSKKMRLKLTLHFQENDYSRPLLRIDYGGLHKNPESLTDDVPPAFRAHKGVWFKVNQPHIHYYITGFGTDWALPLTDDEFSVKNIVSNEDKKIALIELSKKVNLLTNLEVTVQEEIIL